MTEDAPFEASYEPEFEKQLKEIEPDAKRADEFIHGAEWQACHAPKEGKQVDKNVWGIPNNVLPGHPPLVVYYTIDDKKEWVIFISVRISNQPVEVEWLE